MIYDVTSNNDGVTFDSLSTLLSDENLSTLIPSTVRCGGMSIRFVNGSDNKYVQYRYMETINTDDTFINVANWQGVDDEPTSESDNLVKSGGVQQKFVQIEQDKINEKWKDCTINNNPNNFFIYNGYYIHSSGVWANGGSYWTSTFLKLSDLSGLKIKYEIPLNGTPSVVVLFDSDQQQVAEIYPLQALIYEQEIDELISNYPNAIYVRFTIMGLKFSSFEFTPNLVTLQNLLSNVETQVTNAISELNGLNSALQMWRRSDLKVFYIKGFYKVSTETWVEGGTYLTTDYINLKDIDCLIISYSVSEVTSANRITLFDSSKNFVAAITSGEEFNISTIIENNPTAIYARFSIYEQYLSTLKVKQSNIEIYNALTTIQQEISDGAALPSSMSAKIFRRVGVIGDSYTAGYIKIEEDTYNNTYPGWSWVHYMNQLTGECWDNYGRGGSTARTWVLGQERLDEVQKEGNKAQAYIIGLGINDINNLNSHPLGTIDDILTDNDSFYAWYYKLINLILTVNTDAKIFCNTLPRETTIVAQWNQAIREVVEYCHDTENKGVYCCDLASSKYMTSSFYKNPIFTNNHINGHYDAIGYQFMEECYMRVLSDVI